MCLLHASHDEMSPSLRNVCLKFPHLSVLHGGLVSCRTAMFCCLAGQSTFATLVSNCCFACMEEQYDKLWWFCPSEALTQNSTFTTYIHLNLAIFSYIPYAFLVPTSDVFSKEPTAWRYGEYAIAFSRSTLGRFGCRLQINPLVLFHLPTSSLWLSLSHPHLCQTTQLRSASDQPQIQ